jgi:hypothetical protein
VNNKVEQWELYRAGLHAQVAGFAKLRAAQLAPATSSKARNLPESNASSPAKGGNLVPSIDPSIKGREFALNAYEKYAAYMKANPDALKKLGLTPQLATSLLNYVNGKRSVLKIRNCLIGETGRDAALDSVAGYLEILKGVGWITYEAGSDREN